MPHRRSLVVAVDDEENFPESTSRARVAQIASDLYAWLPKRGKPERGREYTTMCAFVLRRKDDDDDDDDAFVVSMATGTKCASFERRGARGVVIADAHAEVLARRGARRWLGEEARAAREGRESAFEIVDGGGGEVKYALRRGFEFVVYCSQSPCGDASVYEDEDADADAAAAKTATQTETGTTIERGSSSSSPPGGGMIKRAKTTGVKGGGAGVTGAKMFEPESSSKDGFFFDAESGAESQARGAWRFKPGRGAPSYCWSCSDKLCRWVTSGFEGSVFSQSLTAPVRPKSIVVAAPIETANAAERALRRAVAQRYFDGQRAFALKNETEYHDVECVIAPPPPAELSSHDGVVQGNRVAAPVSISYIAPPLSAILNPNDGVHAAFAAREWNSPALKNTLEYILGAKGVLHGYGTKDVESGAATSRLAPRVSLARLASNLNLNADVIDPRAPYHVIKDSCRRRQERSNANTDDARDDIVDVRAVRERKRPSSEWTLAD
jgi:tRNA-specific adenosine deaminase 1